MSDLCEYEIKVLRDMAGEAVPGLMWGAAMSEAVERLWELGYAKRTFSGYRITDAGRARLATPQPVEGGEEGR